MTLYELHKILRNWPAFLEAVDPHLGAIIREEWPNPPSFDAALAAVIRPPYSKACAAFAEALAALDRRESAKENGHAATEPAKTKPAPIRAPAATLTDEPKACEPVPPVLYGEVIPPNAGARREGNKTISSRDEVSSNGSATSNSQPVSKRARTLLREQLKQGPRPGDQVEAERAGSCNQRAFGNLGSFSGAAWTVVAAKLSALEPHTFGGCTPVVPTK